MDYRKANQVLGLNQYFGGNAIGLAEAMAPVDDVTYELANREQLVCQNCIFDERLIIKLWEHPDMEDKEESEGAAIDDE